jgi:hypothetical protein
MSYARLTVGQGTSKIIFHALFVFAKHRGFFFSIMDNHKFNVFKM